MVWGILFSDIALNETRAELERCIHRIVELEGKGKFWKEVQGIQSGAIIIQNILCFIFLDGGRERKWQELDFWKKSNKNFL